MSHDEMIAVIAHHQNGGKVEYRGRSEITWWPVMSDPLWNFAAHDYRIKLEPRSLWVVLFQSGNIAGTYTELASAESRAKDLNNSTIHEFKEVLP
jgi:hypothetical protein